MLIFLGFAGEGFKKQEQAILKPGEQVAIDRFVGAARSDPRHRRRPEADGDGRCHRAQRRAACWDACTPRWFFRKHEEEPTTEVAIRRSFCEDLYVTLAGYEMQAQAATYKVTINPLVNWIWAGFGVTGSRNADRVDARERVCVRRRPSPGRSGDDRAVSADAVHAGAGRCAGTRRGPADRCRRPAYAAREGHAGSWCASAPRAGEEHRGMQVPGGRPMRSELAEQVTLGKGRDEISAWFVGRYGSQEPLGAPLDRGFNRLAWVFPYLVGGASLLGVDLVVSRWKKKEGDASRAAGDSAEAAMQAPESRRDALNARLDDELRDLE